MSAAYAFKFVRVTITGTSLNGAEDWQTGFQLGSPSADMVDAQAPAAQNIATAWQTFFTHAQSTISNTYKTNQVKCALILTNGTTVDESIDYYDYPTPITGPSSNPVLPPQLTLAATLTSDFQRGLASKGRMYLPGLTMSINGSTGKISSTQTGELATIFKTFLDSVNAGAGIPGNVAIASKGHKTDQLDINGQPVYENGRTALVTGCRIGDIYDTQRRRRNGLNETYTTRVLA